MSIRGLVLLAILALLGSGQAPATAAEPAKLVVTSPKPHQIFQRHGTAPGTGYAMVPIEGEVPAGTENLEWICITFPRGVMFSTAPFERINVEVKDGKFSGKLRLPAGSYSLAILAKKRSESNTDTVIDFAGDAVAEAMIDPVGVGELFVVAGQSYATNCNDEQLKVGSGINSDEVTGASFPRTNLLSNTPDATEPGERLPNRPLHKGSMVSAFNTATGQWQVAHDPQPTPDGSDGGSIWPPLGDALADHLQVPVGFANVAWGGTSSKQWLPGGTLHPRLAAVGQQLGNCRAVLWQQGESDVIEKTPTETYVENVRTIRDAAFAQWGYSVPWLLAKSTHHPTVYNDPEGEGRIRSAIDALTKLPGFRPGPDTDTLQGENRGDIKSRRHFTGVGQKRAAEMWLAAIKAEFFTSALATAAEPAKLVVTSPKPHQIFQRHGTEPGTGYAMVPIEGEVPAGAENLQWWYAIENLNQPRLLPLAVEVRDGRFKSTIQVPAGWFPLYLMCTKQGEGLDAAILNGTGYLARIFPLGVGEVFVVAGQSYATNCNDERLKVGSGIDSDEVTGASFPRTNLFSKTPDATEPGERLPTHLSHNGLRVSAFNTSTGQWQIANDPQPAPDGSDGGSIWPPLGDALAADLKVPVGFANVAWGGTSSKQWLPGGTLHPRLAAVGQQLGNCRAVLWQQGESDVIEKTPTDTYVENVRTIRDAAFAQWGYSVPWLLAKSTHHPTVYSDPEGEGRIRSAIDALTKLPGFRPGPDTDTLQGDNRGDIKSRRHFTGVGQKRAAEMWLAAIKAEFFTSAPADSLKVGVAEADITPPIGFPMAGYYHERLAEGEIDPLKAKAIAFVGPQSSGALVVCDLIGIATDLKNEVRKRASEKTGIPPENIGISATHSHTAPDYMKELYLRLGNEPQEKLRADYIDKLIGGIVDAIVEAHKSAEPSLIESGSAIQEFPVSFNRRSIMTDGTTRTWMSHDDPRVVRAAGPIDPEIALVTVRKLDGTPRGVLSNFALHLDTVGGAKWSADYPFFIERVLRQSTSSSLISIFGNGCCGDINHVNPKSKVRNTADIIGTSLGNTIDRQLKNPAGLKPLSRSDLVVKSTTIQLALQSADKEEIDKALVILDKARKKEPVDFFDHVTAYKKVMIDGLRHKTPHANTREQITWGLSRSLAGIGETIPVDMTVFALGPDVAIIALPGEVFVDLGLAIKRNSPFKTTLVIELSNCVETIYVPTRAAYAGGSYEVTNSSTMPGSGEQIVETALKLLKEAAHDLQPQVN